MALDKFPLNSVFSALPSEPLQVVNIAILPVVIVVNVTNYTKHNFLFVVTLEISNYVNLKKNARKIMMLVCGNRNDIRQESHWKYYQKLFHYRLLTYNNTINGINSIYNTKTRYKLRNTSTQNNKRATTDLKYQWNIPADYIEDNKRKIIYYNTYTISHPLLVPWSWKSRDIPLPTFWATPGL